MRAGSFLALGFVGLAAVSGCVAEASKDTLRRRASFDFKCAAKLLRAQEIDERTYGVRGCSKRAIYVEQCDGPRSDADTTCTWILNGSVEPD